MQAFVVPDASAKTLAALRWQERPTPVPGPGQVLIETRAVGLNPVDVKLVAAGDPAWRYPHTVGLDVAGVVVALGAGVTQFSIGERVCGHGDLAKDGTFADAVVMPVLALAAIPNALSFETAAACLCAGLTAYQAVHRKLNLANVDTVLVHAGAGGVGSMAIQLLKLAHKRVFTTVSARKQSFVSSLAPAAMIDYRTQDVDSKLHTLTAGHGVDAILNLIGHPEADLPRLAYNGQLVCVLAAPAQLPTDRALSISKIDLGGAHRSGDPRQVADLGRMTRALLALVAAGQVDPLVSQVLPRTELAAGLAMLAADTVVGKLVVKMRS